MRLFGETRQEPKRYCSPSNEKKNKILSEHHDEAFSVDTLGNGAVDFVMSLSLACLCGNT
jgi:hypothetical protein